MRDDEWHIDGAAAIAVYLSGENLVDVNGGAIRDDSFYLALNATAQDMTFTLPDGWLGGTWACEFDTAAPRPFEARQGDTWSAAAEIELRDHSLLLAKRLDPT
jgi:pullulanase/glycogen debranching enzyme